jgi:hypothetical protein
VKIPTFDEVNRSGTQMTEDGPQPLASLVDKHPGLHDVISGVANDCNAPKTDEYTRLKTIFVLGLNLGIRIGENRYK